MYFVKQSCLSIIISCLYSYLCGYKMCTYIHTHIHRCMYVNLNYCHIHIYVCVCVCVCVDMYTYLHIKVTPTSLDIKDATLIYQGLFDNVVVTLVLLFSNIGYDSSRLFNCLGRPPIYFITFMTSVYSICFLFFLLIYVYGVIYPYEYIKSLGDYSR